MELTNAQKRIQERREYVYSAYIKAKDNSPITLLVKQLSKKFNVTEVTIYNDINIGKQ